MGEYTDFTAEIASHLGGITQILNNLQRIIEAIPDKRDKDDIMLVLKSLREGISNFESEINTALEAFIHCRSNCKITRDKLDTLIGAIPDPELMGNMRELVTQLNTEMKEATIKGDGKNPVKWGDLKDIVEYAKRQNKIYLFWKGWKSKLAIVLAVVLGFLMYAEKIFKFFEIAKNFITGG